ncbi:MAG: type II secretion system F family protein [Eubacteriales bacterium]
MQNIILAVLAALFIFFVIIFVLAFIKRDKIRIKQRLGAIAGTENKPHPVKNKKKSERKRNPVSKVFAEELSSSGIRMRPEEFLTIWILATTLPGGILLLLGAHPITIFAIVILGILSPIIIVKRAKDKRLILFEKQLGDALLLMSNCLRAGLTFQQAMNNIAQEMPDPIAKEFDRTIREIQFGGNIDTALANMVQRVKSTDLMLTISAIQIQRQVGGNLMEILENISVTIKERLKLKDDIRVMTASGRISSVVVGLIPVFIGGLLMIINPAYIKTFFDTTMGIGMLITATVMELIGFIIIKKIVTVKY